MEHIANPYGIEALWNQGDFVIRSIAVILLIMSIITWTTVIIRSIHLIKLNFVKRSANSMWNLESIEEAQTIINKTSLTPIHNTYGYILSEANRAYEIHNNESNQLNHKLTLVDWLQTSIQNAIDQSTEQMQKGLNALASIGSTAPFVGLFGTVWGIYHALVKISTTGQVGIDKVAGPVGEALIMTAFGLAVAIPAVLAYNTLVRYNKKIIRHANHFAHQIQTYYLSK